jgi:hypothetical protein
MFQLVTKRLFINWIFICVSVIPILLSLISFINFQPPPNYGSPCPSLYGYGIGTIIIYTWNILLWSYGIHIINKINKMNKINKTTNFNNSLVSHSQTSYFIGIMILLEFSVLCHMSYFLITQCSNDDKLNWNNYKENTETFVIITSYLTFLIAGIYLISTILLEMLSCLGCCSERNDNESDSSYEYEYV